MPFTFKEMVYTQMNIVLVVTIIPNLSGFNDCKDWVGFVPQKRINDNRIVIFWVNYSICLNVIAIDQKRVG